MATPIKQSDLKGKEVIVYEEMESIEENNSFVALSEDKNKSERNKKRRGRPRNFAPKRNRTKLVWSNWLHLRFLEAINLVGFQNATPSSILDFMGVSGISRDNVASHLQKYRKLLEKVAKKGIWWINKPKSRAFRSCYASEGHSSLLSNARIHININHSGLRFNTTTNFRQPSPLPLHSSTNVGTTVSFNRMSDASNLFNSGPWAAATVNSFELPNNVGNRLTSYGQLMGASTQAGASSSSAPPPEFWNGNQIEISPANQENATDSAALIWNNEEEFGEEYEGLAELLFGSTTTPILQNPAVDEGLNDESSFYSAVNKLLHAQDKPQPSSNQEQLQINKANSTEPRSSVICFDGNAISPENLDWGEGLLDFLLGNE